MSTQVVEYRRSNGRRLEGAALAASVAAHLTGMTLAQAYMSAKSSGLTLKIRKHDGVPRGPSWDDARRNDRVIVDVVKGCVARSWLG